MTDHLPQVHPESQRLVEANSLLREELVRLLTDLDDLVQIVKPNLLAIYQTKIGLWELRALKAQFEVARWKRRIELVQACLNRGQRPDLAEIDRQIELDCLAWHKKLQEAQQRIEAAESRLQHLMSPMDDQEFKTLYCALVKQLHPDVSPNLTEDRRRLWQRVQRAFLAGDLTEMRALALLEKECSGEAAPATSLEELLRDQKILKAQIDVLQQRIDAIESQPPFTLREQLEDDEWVAARRAEKDTEIDQLQARQIALESHFHQLLRGYGHGNRFSQN